MAIAFTATHVSIAAEHILYVNVEKYIKEKRIVQNKEHKRIITKWEIEQSGITSHIRKEKCTHYPCWHDIKKIKRLLLENGKRQHISLLASCVISVGIPSWPGLELFNIFLYISKKKNNYNYFNIIPALVRSQTIYAVCMVQLKYGKKL